MLFNNVFLHLDAGLLKDLFQGSVAEDKLGVLAEQQFKELVHATHCKSVCFQFCKNWTKI